MGGWDHRDLGLGEEVGQKDGAEVTFVRDTAEPGQLLPPPLPTPRCC